MTNLPIYIFSTVLVKHHFHVYEGKNVSYTRDMTTRSQLLVNRIIIPEFKVLVAVKPNDCNLYINNIKSVVVANRLSKSILEAI